MTRKETVILEDRKEWLGQLKKLVLKNIDKENYAIFLFGSAVNDLLRANDIDIGILGKKVLPDNIKNRIIEEVEESVIPYKVDIVDFHDTGRKFKKFSLNNIKVWNQPKNISLS
jgi:uncharacterized protein